MIHINNLEFIRLTETGQAWADHVYNVSNVLKSKNKSKDADYEVTIKYNGGTIITTRKDDKISYNFIEPDIFIDSNVYDCIMSNQNGTILE